METLHVRYKDIEADFIPYSMDDEITRKHWSKGRFYEAQPGELLDVLYQERGKYKNVVDVGAHLGNHAVFFAKMGADVIAVEPIHHDLLQQNVYLNNVMDDVSVFSVAAHWLVDDLRLTEGANSGMWHVSDKGRSVYCTPIDELPDGRVDLIKIDVEGHELQAICGAIGLIDRYAPAIAVEIQQNKAAIDAVLATWGYKPTKTRNATPTYLYRQ